MASFEQAVLKVEKPREFAALQDAIARAFAPEKVEKLLARLAQRRLRVRDWESVLTSGVFDEVEGGETAQSLYVSLAVSDQAQIRELYLFRVEEVSPKLRARFHRLYQYC